MADLYNVTAGETALAADVNQYKTALEGGSQQLWALHQKAGANLRLRLATNDGTDKLTIQDSDGNEVGSIDSDGNLILDGSISTGSFVFPVSASPSQTTDGQAVWDSDDNVLTVGDGSSRKTLGYVGSTVALANGTASAGSSNEVSRVDHVHPGNRVVKYKSSAQQFSASTTFADITATSGNLAFAIAANEVWQARWVLPITTGAANTGAKVQLTGPAAPTLVSYVATFLANQNFIGASDAMQQTNTPSYSVAAFAFSTSIGVTSVANQVNGGGNAGLSQNAGAGAFSIIIEALIVNGTNAGTVTLQGAQNAATSTTDFAAGCYMVAERVA